MINKLINNSKEIDESKVITFTKGIPGFEHLRKFIILPIKDNELFYLLQSIEDKELSFVVISPFSVDPNYEICLDDNTISSLKIITENQVVLLNTVTLDSNVTKITTNFAAPIIINIDERIGEQIILNNDKYKIKTPIFKE